MYFNQKPSLIVDQNGFRMCQECTGFIIQYLKPKLLEFFMSFYMKILSESLIVCIHSLMLLRFVIIITNKRSLN